MQSPPTVRVAAAVQAAEAAMVCAASALSAVDAAAGQSYQAASGVALTVIGFGTAVMLGFVAAGLARARRWSRTPALLTQLFTGIVGIYLVQGHRYDWGVLAVALATWSVKDPSINHATEGPVRNLLGLPGAIVADLVMQIPPSLRALASGRPVPPAGPPGGAG